MEKRCCRSICYLCYCGVVMWQYSSGLRKGCCLGGLVVNAGHMVNVWMACLVSSNQRMMLLFGATSEIRH